MRSVIFFMVAAACISSVGVEPKRADVFAFIRTFRISHYLAVASDLQKLEPDNRVERLRALAIDPDRASELFPLCKMLFEARAKQEVRRPMIGAACFVDGRDYADWPLEPIAIHKNVPILVVSGYVLGGRPESPLQYLEYCLDACAWRHTKYEVMADDTLTQIVNDFLASNPSCKANGQWFLDQAK